MIEINEIEKAKKAVEELLQKMNVTVFDVELKAFSKKDQTPNEEKDFLEINVSTQEPQILIGQQGQTLFELQRILRIVLTKKLQKFFYVNLDINDYKKKKIEYLKDLAVTMANEVAKTKEIKVLPPMSSYERRIIHTELAERQDIVTGSQGEEADRCIVISPR